MRGSLSLFAALLLLLTATHASAQTSQTAFTTNLSRGSSGPQVLALQKVLNQDLATRIASTGPGSPGNETDYFGSLTAAAAVRFQEKYAGDILTPVGLTSGTGYVGVSTRSKLNMLSGSTIAATPVLTTPPAVVTSSAADYLVKETEKVDVYAGDKMLTNIQNKITDTVNAAIASRVASQSSEPITLPSITAANLPSVTLGTPAPRSAIPGTSVTVTGKGISTNSVVYFGNTYIVRSVTKDSLGNYSFVVPPIPPGRYDIGVRTGGTVSNTTSFVITDPKNPSVRLTSVSPANIGYGGTLTITGSGFSAQNNLVVTTNQTFNNVPSSDGTTLRVTLSPESLREYAKVTHGTVAIPMSVYVVSDYGFSDTMKSFTMTL